MDAVATLYINVNPLGRMSNCCTAQNMEAVAQSLLLQRVQSGDVI